MVPRTIAVGGGKGGVGKTLVAANLAVALADEGRSVVAVDADLAGANLHSCLGERARESCLADFLLGREPDLGKLVADARIPNLRWIGSSTGHPGFAKLRPARHAEFARALRALACDFVILDVGAGVHPEVVDFFLLGDDALLVLLPEPTALENAYGFLRAALHRRLELASPSEEAREHVREALDPRNERGVRTPLDLLRDLQALGGDEAARCEEALRRFRPRLLVNQVRSVDDIRLGFSVASVCRKYFGLDAEYLGYVNHDECVRQAVLAREPVVRAFPASDAAVYLKRIARKLAASPPGVAP
jgi:flagellar biosynthesis protein FlhG